MKNTLSGLLLLLDKLMRSRYATASQPLGKPNPNYNGRKFPPGESLTLKPQSLTEKEPMVIRQALPSFFLRAIGKAP